MSTKIYIPNVPVNDANRRKIFALTRPFLTKSYEWKNDAHTFERWGLNHAYFTLVNDYTDAHFVLIPSAINDYLKKQDLKKLREINDYRAKANIRAYGYISGDFGVHYKEFSHIFYFRMGGFRRQLPAQNVGFPILVGDQFKNMGCFAFAKAKLPTVGFCGHATKSTVKKYKEYAKCLLENGRRFLSNPFGTTYEPLFASGYERAKLLALLEASDLVKTHFIYRDNYRANAVTHAQRDATTQEYFENMRHAAYVLCLRGVGNFSVRLYETLMMGKIPIFVDTDCILPFEDSINWKDHVVWVNWPDRKNIAEIVSNFHARISNDDFVQLQERNRQLWQERLSVHGMLKTIANDF